MLDNCMMPEAGLLFFEVLPVVVSRQWPEHF